MKLLTSRNTRVTSLPASLALAAVLALLPAVTGHAANVTWSSSTTGTNWNTGANWSSTPANTDSLYFGATATSGTLNNDIATSSTFNGLTFNSGAAAYTLLGNAITLGGSITNSSTSLQTIAFGITTTAVRTVTLTAGGGNILISGNVSGAAGGFTLGGSGTATLSGSNSYAGNTTIAANQTLNINNNSALGSGTFVINGSGSFDNTSGSDKTIANNFNLSNGSPTFIGTNNLSITGTTRISGASRTITVSSGTLTLSVLDADTTARTFTKNGSGAMVLSGSATSGFQGGVTLSAGTLWIGNQYALGSGAFAISGGTFDNSSGGALVLSNTAALATADSTFGGAADLSFAASTIASNRTITLSGSGSLNLGNLLNTQNSNTTLTVNGAGKTLTIASFGLSNNATGRTDTIAGSGNVTFTGAITSGSAATGALTITNTGTVTLGGNSSYVGAFQQTGAGTVSITGTMNGPTGVTINNASAIFNESSTGAIQGATTTFTLTTGTAILSGSNSYGGTTTFTAGNLQVGNNNALGSGTITLTAGTLQAVGGSVSLANPAMLTAVTVGGSNNLTLSGGLTNSGGNRTLTSSITGGNTLTLSGTTFLQESGTAVGRTLTIAGTGNTNLSGPIVDGGTGGSSSLTITSTGTTTLSGSNSYTGTTTLSTAGSVIALNNDYALGSSSVLMSNGVTTTILSTNGPHTYANRFTTGSSGTSGIIGGTNQLTFSGLIENTIAGNGVLTVNDTAGVVFSGTIQATRESGGGGAQNFLLYGNGPITISGLMRNNTLGDAAGFTYNGSSTLTISGSNTYTGPTTLNSGTMAVTGVGTLGASGSSALTVAGGILDLGTTSQTVASFNMSGPSIVQNGTLYSLSGTSFLASFTGTSTISASLAGSGATLQKSSSGKLILAGSNSYTGTTLITGSGMLQATQPNALLNTASVNASNIGSTLAVNYGGAGEYTAGDVVSLLAKTTGTSAAFFGFDTTNAGGSATYGNNLTMNMGLEKHGTGTLVLTGSNSYTGATTVNVGTLQFGAGNPNALGSTSGIIVASGAALDLNGNAFTLTTGKTLTNSGTVNGAFTVNSGATATLNGGSTNGNVNVSGTMNIAGSTNLVLGTIDGSGTAGTISNNNTFTSGSGVILTFANGSSFNSVSAAASTKTTLTNGGGTTYVSSFFRALNATINVTLDGGTWNISSLAQNNSNAQFGGTMNIIDGAVLNQSSARYTGHGTYNVGGTGTGTFNIGSGWSVENPSTNWGAVYNAQNGGTITSLSSMTISTSGSNTTAVTNSQNVFAGGLISITGNLTIGGASAQGTGGSENNTLSVSGGKLLVSSSISMAAPLANVTNTFNWTGGQISAAGINATNLPSGTLTNNGASGTTLAPGDTGFTGKTAVTGNYTQGANGTLAIDLGGTTSSTIFQDALGTGKYDQVAVTGTTSLNGTLTLNLLAGFTMSSTNSLSVLTSGSALSGAFSNVASGSTLTAADGSVFMVTYSGATKTVALTTGSAGLNQWSGASAGNWSTGGNWTVNTPNSSAYTARFGDATASTGAITVNLDSNETVNSLAFTSTTTRAYTISSGNGSTLTLDNGSSAAVINDLKNSQTVSTGITLNSDLAVFVANAADTLTLSAGLNWAGRVLTVNGAGKLALTNNDTFGTINTATTGTTSLTGNDTITTLNVSAGTASLTGTNVITTLNVSGGTAALSGSNTLGATNVTGGTLAVNSASALGTTPVLATAGTVQFNVSTSSATGLPLITATNGAIVNLGTSGITVNNPIAFGNGGSTNILTGPTSGTATLAGNISIASGFSPRFDAGGNSTTLIISGTITNTDTAQSIMFNRSTTGTILLTASNSFAGGGTWVNGSSPIGTIFYSGTTKLGTNNVFGPASILTYGVAGASLDLNGYNQSFQSTYGGNGNVAGRFGIITNSAPATTGTLTFNTTANNVRVATDASAAYQYLTAAVQDGSGAVAVVKTGTATMTFINNGSYSGGTTVNNGTLKGYQGTAFGSGSVTLNSGLFNVDFNTFATSGTSGALALSNTAAGTVILAGGDMVMNGRPSNAGVSLNGSTQNAGGSNPSDGRLFTLTGTNTTAGLAVGMTVSGTNTNSYIATIIDSTHFLMNAGSTASSSGTFTLGAVTNTTAQTYAGLQVNSAGNVTVNNNGGGGTTLTFNSLSGTASLTKAGDGTMVVNGTNSYSGTTNVSAGTLTLGSNLALQNSTIDTSGTGVINASSATAPIFGGLTGSTDLASVITTGYGAVTGITLNPGGGVTRTYSGVIADGTSGMTLTKTGPGTQVLSGSNTYTGITTVNSGTLVNGNTNALPVGTTLVLGGTDNSVGSYDLAGYNQTIASLTSLGLGGPNVITNSSGVTDSELKMSNGGTFAGRIQDGPSRKTNVTVDGGTLTLSPGAELALSGTIAINNGGTLLLGGSNQINNAASVNLNGGTFEIGGNSDSVGALTLSQSSTIDFNNGTNTMRFASLTGDTSNTLALTNWTSGASHLVFTSSVAGNTNFLGGVSFNGLSGAQQISFNDGNGSGYELVPVPEPATIIGAFAFVGLIFLRERRRIVLLWKKTTALE